MKGTLSEHDFIVAAGPASQTYISRLAPLVFGVGPVMRFLFSAALLAVALMSMPNAVAELDPGEFVACTLDQIPGYPLAVQKCILALTWEVCNEYDPLETCPIDWVDCPRTCHE